MQIARKAISIFGAIFLAALLIAALAPKAARSSVVAAVVQVTNTSANAVSNVDVNTPAEQPFGTILCDSSGIFALRCPSSEPNVFQVPSTTTDGATVKRLVIENLSGVCETSEISGAVVVRSVAITTTTRENTVDGSIVMGALVPVPATTPGSSMVFGQPTRFYADPGSFVRVGVFAGGGIQDFMCNAAVNGYLVTK